MKYRLLQEREINRIGESRRFEMDRCRIAFEISPSRKGSPPKAAHKNWMACYML
jgi:hypothetical protein